MGRSKFPGKPSKHVHKKRVNVLPCTILPNSDTTTQKNNTVSICNNLQTEQNQVNVS